jgi:hypothetical protein
MSDSESQDTRATPTTTALIASSTTPDEKRPNGTIQLPATGKEIDEFIRWKIKIYDENRWIGTDLSIYYGEDFGIFKSEIFKMASPINLRNLRHGVYVNRARFVHTADTLTEAIKEELIWPEDDPDNPHHHTTGSVQTREHTPAAVFTPIHAHTYAHTQRPSPISNRTTQI